MCQFRLPVLSVWPDRPLGKVLMICTNGQIQHVIGPKTMVETAWKQLARLSENVHRLCGGLLFSIALDRYRHCVSGKNSGGWLIWVIPRSLVRRYIECERHGIIELGRLHPACCQCLIEVLIRIVTTKGSSR